MDKDGGRDRRQARMLMEDINTFDELEEIMGDVSLECKEINTLNTFTD